MRFPECGCLEVTHPDRRYLKAIQFGRLGLAACDGLFSARLVDLYSLKRTQSQAIVMPPQAQNHLMPRFDQSYRSSDQLY